MDNQHESDYPAARQKVEQAAVGSPRQIAVLGAGIGGLFAAYLLSDKGHRVTVYEASSRIGGRILTHHYAGRHAELGGMRIPSSGTATHALCQEFGLELVPFANWDANTLLDIRGIVAHQHEVARIVDRFALDLLDRQAVARDPNSILAGLAAQLMASLTLEDLACIKLGTMGNARARVIELESTSIRDYFLRHARNGEGAEFAAALHYLDDVWLCSCAGLVREIIRSQTARDFSQIDHGMEALPRAVHARIEHDPNVEWRLSTPVTGIAAARHHVTVRTDAGESEYDQVLCTIPFPVLHTMSLEGLSAQKLAAIRHFRYAPSTKVLVQFKESFWRDEPQPIHGGITVSDEIVGQVVYPTDFRTAAPGDVNLPLVFPVVADKPIAPSASRAAYTGPDLLMSYTWGDRARRLSRLSVEDRVEVVLRCLARIHGRQVWELADGGVSMAWERYPWSGGAFSQPAVSDLRLYYAAACRPEGALFFAGEHLSANPGWIHGAIDSSLLAVERMLTSS